MVEEQFALVVQSLQANRVISVQFGVINIHDLSVLVVDAKPLRFFWMHNLVVVPHEQAKVCHVHQVLLVPVGWVSLIVNIWQEDAVFVVAVQVPPSAEIISWRTELLDNLELDHVTCQPVKWPAVLVLAELVSGNALMWSAIGKKSMHIEAFALLNDAASNQTSLRKANDIYLLTCKVWVSSKRVTCLMNLPIHLFKLGSGCTVTDFNALDYGGIVDTGSNSVSPWSLWA